MAFGASVDVLGGVVTRATPCVAGSPPGCTRAGVRVGVLDGVMARATLLDIHGYMHMDRRCRLGFLALRRSTIIKVSMK